MHYFSDTNLFFAIVVLLLLCIEYGLGSSVYTQDSEKANRIASLIDAGQVGINCYPLDCMGIQCPWYVTLLDRV